MTLPLRNRYHATKLVMLFGWLFVVVIIPLQAKWEKLEACRLVDHVSNDGDSFRVEVPDGRQLQFRLYFVDTPELGLFYPDRVKEQADYFGISQQAVLDLGSQASAFTKGFLRDKKFTVLTEWKDAWGLQKRYAALVHCENKSLIEALVGNGLVRLRGFQTDGPLPGGSSSSDYQNLLRRIEKKAKSDRVGGWGISIGKQNTRFLGVDRIDPTQKADKIGGDEIVLIDLNRANDEEIDLLPGIGPVLADRIVNARPFTQVENLLKVKGIGEHLLNKMKPLVTLGFDPSLAKTAAFYLEDPEEWNGREIELSISDLMLQSREAPDGFVSLLANTALEGQPGGSIPLYLREERVREALYFFEHSKRELLLRVRFFKYEDRWVTAYYKKTPVPTE